MEELLKKFNDLNVSVDTINERIKREICLDTIEKLTDKALLKNYMETDSVKHKVSSLRNILTEEGIEDEKTDKIIQRYILELIPPGTKGTIRGNKFNQIVKEKILSFAIDEEKYEIRFETKHKIHTTSEIPDWYIYEKDTDKIIIGMNQLSIVGGGQQINRGFKYLDPLLNTEKFKLLCVICNDLVIKSAKSNEYKLYSSGFKNDTLCYLGNLYPIIKEFFKF
jgi:hypothetical protein